MKDKINFLHINASDIRWGASLTGFRFHKALLEKGFGSQILCGLKESKDTHTASIVPGRFGYIPNTVIGKLFNCLGLQSFGYPSSFFLKHSKWINQWADVVILRNLHWWYFSIGILPWMAKKVPLIWRFPDMWAFTGHCAYSYECERWKIGCGSCPYLRDYPELLFDTTKFLWQRKQRIYQKLKGRLAFVSSSQWLLHKMKESPLIRDFRCEIIPTAVNLEVFKPMPKKEIRDKLGIGKNEKAIMLSSVKLTDKRKGIEDIFAAIRTLKEKVSFPLTLLLLGHRAEKLKVPAGIKVINSGFVDCDRLLAEYYNASDVYLSMSEADNLPNALIEAAACAVPIVTLDSGGCSEALRDGKSGYVVKNNYEAIEALKNILSDEEKQEEFSKNAREFAESKFSMEAQADAYVNLAKELIVSCD